MGGKKSSLLQKVNHPLAKFSSPLLPPFGTQTSKTVAVPPGAGSPLVGNGTKPRARARHQRQPHSPGSTRQVRHPRRHVAPPSCNVRAGVWTDACMAEISAHLPSATPPSRFSLFVFVDACYSLIEFAVGPPSPCVAEISADGRRSGRDPSLSAMRSTRKRPIRGRTFFSLN
jgi:hypothetical protein